LLLERGGLREMLRGCVCLTFARGIPLLGRPEAAVGFRDEIPALIKERRRALASRPQHAVEGKYIARDWTPSIRSNRSHSRRDPARPLSSKILDVMGSARDEPQAGVTGMTSSQWSRVCSRTMAGELRYWGRHNSQIHRCDGRDRDASGLRKDRRGGYVVVADRDSCAIRSGIGGRPRGLHCRARAGVVR